MWLKVDDKLHDHLKVHALLERGQLEALGLWVVAGSWCGDQMSDGLISGYVLGRFAPTNWQTLAEQLVDVGLWEAVPETDRPQFQFHDWDIYNDTREEIEADRLAAKIRKELYADPDLVTAIKKRDKDRCRYCGCRVKWNDRRSLGGGTFDHIKPIVDGGTNTIENVVVCCRRCNGKKGKKTLRAAGMKLLKPGSLGAPVLETDRTSSAGVEDRVGSGRGQVGNQYGSSSTGETDKQIVRRILMEDGDPLGLGTDDGDPR